MHRGICSEIARPYRDIHPIKKDQRAKMHHHAHFIYEIGKVPLTKHARDVICVVFRIKDD